MIFCHKTHFCGRYSAPDLRQTGGPSGLRGHFCPLIWHSQVCIGLVCHPARFARWVAIIIIFTPVPTEMDELITMHNTDDTQLESKLNIQENTPTFGVRLVKAALVVY